MESYIYIKPTLENVMNAFALSTQFYHVSVHKLTAYSFYEIKIFFRVSPKL